MEKIQMYKVILHQLSQAGFAQDHDCNVILTSSTIFWSWLHLQIVSFLFEFTGAKIGQLNAIKLSAGTLTKTC